MGGHQGFTTPMILASLWPLSFLPSSVAALKWHPKEWNWDSLIKYGDIPLFVTATQKWCWVLNPSLQPFAKSYVKRRGAKITWTWSLVCTQCRCVFVLSEMIQALWAVCLIEPRQFISPDLYQLNLIINNLNNPLTSLNRFVYWDENLSLSTYRKSSGFNSTMLRL